MKKSRISGEQIACAQRLADSGTLVVDVCRQIGVTEFRRSKMLEDESARLWPSLLI